MGKTLFTALAAMALLSGPVAAESVAAMTQATTQPSAFAAPTQIATIMCGSNGCGIVQTKQQRRRKFQTLGHG